MMDGYNLADVIATAQRKARKRAEVWYVIYADEHNGCYHAVNDFDMETFYMGTPDSAIRFCTA